MRMKKKSAEPYFTNPAWHLLATTEKALADWTPTEKTQAEFILLLERLSGKKPTLSVGKALTEAWQQCCSAVKEYGDVLKDINNRKEISQAIERFMRNEGFGYSSKALIDKAGKKAVDAFQALRQQLEKHFFPKQFNSIAKELVNRVTRYLITQKERGTK